MIRTTALPAAVLVGVALLAPTTAYAAGETCHGVPATHVGSPTTYELRTTEGPDVVVTNGASDVETFGGDDLVCVTGEANPGIWTGDGDDVVDSSQSGGEFMTTVLGDGSDRFTGSTASDTVYAGGQDRRGLVDTDRDVVDTGLPGRGLGDTVTSGQPGESNSDEVRLAGGRSARGGFTSTLHLHGQPTAQSVLDGRGHSGLVLETSDASRITIDTAVGTYSRDGETATISGFDDFTLINRVETRYITFRGSDRDETIRMTTTRNSAYDVDMAGGDDLIVVETDRIHRRVNVFDGGDGVDQLGIVMPRKQVRLDLRRGQLLAGKPRNAVPAKAVGFEDAEVVADHIELTGTGNDNDLRADGCDVTVRALGGDDLVSPITQLYDKLLRCGGKRARFEGGAGGDTLVGDAGVDVLIGGRGRDVANGGAGRDTCHAETTKQCEVRR